MECSDDFQRCIVQSIFEELKYRIYAVYTFQIYNRSLLFHLSTSMARIQAKLRKFCLPHFDNAMKGNEGAESKTKHDEKQWHGWHLGQSNEQKRTHACKRNEKEEKKNRHNIKSLYNTKCNQWLLRLNTPENKIKLRAKKWKEKEQ